MSVPKQPQQSDRQRTLIAWSIGGLIILGFLFTFSLFIYKTLHNRLPEGAWSIIKSNCKTGEFTLVAPCPGAADEVSRKVKIDVQNDLNTCWHIDRDKDGKQYRPATLFVNHDADYAWAEGKVNCSPTPAP